MNAVKPQELRYQKVNEVDPNNHQIGSALYISSHHLLYIFFLPHFFHLSKQSKKKWNEIKFIPHIWFFSHRCWPSDSYDEKSKQKSSCENWVNSIIAFDRKKTVEDNQWTIKVISWALYLSGFYLL